jgi:hypothetical protein
LVEGKWIFEMSEDDNIKINRCLTKIIQDAEEEQTDLEAVQLPLAIGANERKEVKRKIEAASYRFRKNDRKGCD